MLFFTIVVYFLGAYLLNIKEKAAKLKPNFGLAPKIILGFISACSTYTHTTIIDIIWSHLKGADLKRYHDDLFTCQEIAANQDVNKKKTRIFTERCMEGRGYVILDKDM